MAKAELVVGIGGVGCNIMSYKVPRQISHICFLGVDTSEPMACTTEDVPNTIQSELYGWAVAWAQLEECVRHSGIRMRGRKYRAWTDHIQTMRKRIQDAYTRCTDNAYDRMVQQLRNKSILAFDLCTATSDLTNDRTEWNCDRFLDLTIHQKFHLPENKSRHLQLRGKMTQILDVLKRTPRARSESVRRHFDYSMTFSRFGDQSWVTTGLCSEIRDPANTKQYDLNGFPSGMWNAPTVANQSISALLRSLLIRCVHPQIELPGTLYLRQHDTMLGDERIRTTANLIKACVCELLWWPISANHKPKLFAFSPKLQKGARGGQIPVMLAA